jgi:putative ABC transport system permease protein
MIRNYLLTAYRNASKNRLYAFINILGLTVGVSCCILILLYVRHERSYDQFHDKKDRIFKVYRTNASEGYEEIGPTSAPFATALENDFPQELEAAVRIMPRQGLITEGENAYTGDKISFVDPAFFQVFTYPLQQGNPETALQKPGSVVLSQEMAIKYFGDQNPMGKELTYNEEYPLIVTGVLAPLPENTHHTFDMLGSVLMFQNQSWFEGWWNNNMMTYVLLKEGMAETELEAQFPAFMDKYMGGDFEQYGVKVGLTLTPITEIYFQANTQFDVWTKHGNETMTYVFLVIAVFVLIIACINFMNLATARAARRATEVGVRKTLGARRNDLVYQFYAESFLTSVIAVLLSVVLINLSLPFFNQFADLTLTIPAGDTTMILIFAGVAIAVGLLAGSYPALFLSSFLPARVLKGSIKTGKGANAVRKGLVVFQFAISITLLVAVLVVSQQMNYLQDKRLGFDKERVLLVEIDNDEIYEKREDFKDRLSQDARITSVSLMSGEPGGFHDMYGFKVEGLEEDMLMNTVMTDENYLDAMGLELLAGRNFSVERPTDTRESLIINQTAAKALGWTAEEALGKEMMNTFRDSIPKRVIGVVNDYHFASLHQKIDPLVISMEDDNRMIAIKLTAGETSPVIAQVGSVWSDFVTQHPFSYQFLDESFASLYKAEQKQGQIFMLFAGIAVFIACLGLFGLVTFVAEQRTKEIGVRKVLGASVPQLVRLLTKDFAILVGIALLMASPIAYYAMSQWLSDFAYRIELQPLIFLLAGLIALIIALLTVSIKSYQAATDNPVKSLRSE